MRHALPRTCLSTAALALLSCFNPFFPPTGTPREAAGTRETPAGVIKQLVSSYERKNIYLFYDLLSPSYRFYVSPMFVSEYQSEQRAQYEEILGGQYRYIQGGRYYYWSGDVEKRAHQNLFETALQITFTTRPYLNENNFVYTVAVKSDTVGTVFDSLSNVLVPDIRTTYDTTNVELRMLSGEIEISLKDDGGRFVIDIGEQVFSLARDPANTALWVIEKWFDLGTASYN